MTTKDLLFKIYIFPEKQVFPIKIANTQEFPASVKSYNDKISVMMNQKIKFHMILSIIGMRINMILVSIK